MKRHAHHRPSAAMVVACAALLVSLGGVSYAAIKLPKNSVGTKQIINRSVRTIDLSKGTVGARSRVRRVPRAPVGRPTS
jgi:hypothetical protein